MREFLFFLKTLSRLLTQAASMIACSSSHISAPSLLAGVFATEKRFVVYFSFSPTFFQDSDATIVDKGATGLESIILCLWQAGFVCRFILGWLLCVVLVTTVACCATMDEAVLNCSKKRDWPGFRTPVFLDPRAEVCADFWIKGYSVFFASATRFSAPDSFA